MSEMPNKNLAARQPLEDESSSDISWIFTSNEMTLDQFVNSLHSHEQISDVSVTRIFQSPLTSTPVQPQNQTAQSKTCAKIDEFISREIPKSALSNESDSGNVITMQCFGTINQQTHGAFSQQSPSSNPSFRFSLKRKRGIDLNRNIKLNENFKSNRPHDQSFTYESGLNEFDIWNNRPRESPVTFAQPAAHVSPNSTIIVFQPGLDQNPRIENTPPDVIRADEYRRHVSVYNYESITKAIEEVISDSEFESDENLEDDPQGLDNDDDDNGCVPSNFISEGDGDATVDESNSPIISMNQAIGPQKNAENVRSWKFEIQTSKLKYV